MSRYPYLQAGTVDVGPSSTEVITVTVTYKPFAQTPVFVATPLGQDYDDTFTVTSQTIGLSTATVKICRNDGNSWSQDLQLNWIAVPYSNNPNNGYLAGKKP
jgi:hypothetical protein